MCILLQVKFKFTNVEQELYYFELQIVVKQSELIH